MQSSHLRRGTALATEQRAQTGSAAQVGHDDPPVGSGSHDIGQDVGDVFIGEPMKAVAPDTQRRHVPRQSKALGDMRERAMKGRVETGHLGNIGIEPGNCLDRRKVMRLM